MSGEDLLKVVPHKSTTLLWDRVTNRYYLLLPLPVDFNVEVSARHKGQNCRIPLYRSSGKNHAGSMIALDPGVRTFQTGYGPEGLWEWGKEAKVRLGKLLLQADKAKRRRVRLRLLQRVRDLVSDLHWKTINQLCRFRVVFLPVFRVSQMVRGNLPPQVKKLLYTFRYFDFQTKLVWKAGLSGTVVHIVNESWTSKTCTSCGEVKSGLKGEEIFACDFCGLEIRSGLPGCSKHILEEPKSALQPALIGCE